MKNIFQRRKPQTTVERIIDRRRRAERDARLVQLLTK